MRVALLFFSLTYLSVQAGTAEEDWKRLLALDAGPGKPVTTAEDALRISLAHLDAQEKALRDFLQGHAGDDHVFAARLRLARLLSLRSELKDQIEPDEVDRLMKQAEEAIKTPSERADFDFSVVTREMRHWQGKRATPEGRASVLAATRQFQKAHPKDPRVPALLVETATLFEGAADKKETLLREANRLTNDPAIKAQIADDLKRLSSLGKVLPLKFTGLDGKAYDAKMWRGRPVLVIFFAAASEPARGSFADVQDALAPFGDQVVLVGVSLDQRREDAEKFLADRKAAIPVAWDGKGWGSPIVQALGINAVPSAWLLDQKGVVRTLDALENPAALVKQLR